MNCGIALTSGKPLKPVWYSQRNRIQIFIEGSFDVMWPQQRQIFQEVEVVWLLIYVCACNYGGMARGGLGGGWGVLNEWGDRPLGITVASGAYEVVWLLNQVTWSRSGAPQTFPMMVGLICQTCGSLGVHTLSGATDRESDRPPLPKTLHMFTSSRPFALRWLQGLCSAVWKCWTHCDVHLVYFHTNSDGALILKL